jgi:hypothetical protein
MSTAPKYDAEAVNKVIAASRPRIGGKEAKLIHALLRGRQPKAKGGAS